MRSSPSPEDKWPANSPDEGPGHAGILVQVYDCFLLKTARASLATLRDATNTRDMCVVKAKSGRGAVAGLSGRRRPSEVGLGPRIYNFELRRPVFENRKSEPVINVKLLDLYFCSTI